MAPSSSSVPDLSTFGMSSLRPQIDLRPLDSIKSNSDNEQDLAVADLLNAAVDGDVPRVRKLAMKLIQAGIGVDVAVAAVDDPGSKRQGPLHLAAAAGKVGICKMLIEDFDANVNATDIEGATPLIFAVQGLGSTAVVGLLLNHGADANKADNGGIVPLHIAAERGSSEVAELLLSKGAEVDPIWEKGGAPVHIASQHGNARILKLLLQHNADCNRLSSSFNTPLAACLFGSSLECMEILIEAGADVNAGSPESPLMIAAGKGLIDCVKCLLKAGADANIPDENGKVPVEIAASKGWEECVKTLYPVTTPLAEYSDWSIDGIILPEKIAAPDMNSADSTFDAKSALCFHQMNDNEEGLADANPFIDMQPDSPESSESEDSSSTNKLVEEHCQGIEELMSDLHLGSGTNPVDDACSVTRDAAMRQQQRSVGREAAAVPPPRRSTRARKPNMRISGPEWTK